MLDGFVGHRRLQVPAGIALEGIDRRRIAEEVGLPLAGIAADKAIEVIETHTRRPLIERPSLACLEERRVVVLAEPGRRISIVPEDRTDGRLLDRDNGIIAGIARSDFADHAEADGVMIAAGDECRARRRAQRGRVEIRVAQAALGDAVHGGRRYDAAECARSAETLVIGHDQQNVGSALRRYDARRPPGRRLGGLLLDHAAKGRIGRRKLLAADRRRRFGRARYAVHLLRRCTLRRKKPIKAQYHKRREASDQVHWVDTP